MQKDALILHRTPQALNHDIIHPAAFAVHRDLYAGFSQRLGKRQTCKLATLIGVEDIRLAEAAKCFFQCRYTEVCIQRIA